MTAAEIVARANAAGWIVNNLFQTDGRLWRCNFRREKPGARDDFTEIATAPSLEAALAAAFAELDLPDDDEDVFA